MKNIISKSLSDIFSATVLSFIVKIGLGSILLWIVILWSSWDIYSSLIYTYIQKIPYIGSLEWIQSSGTFMIAILVGYMLIIVTISIATSIFSEPILKKLAKKHYPNVDIVGSPNIAKSTYLSIKAGVVFLILFLFSSPLIFVPIFGQVWMLWLWSILIKEPNSYDVGSLFISDKEILKDGKKKSTLIAMVASLFNYIPIVNIFAPLFGQILFLHKILTKK